MVRLILAIGTGRIGPSVLNGGLPDMGRVRPAAPELTGGDPYGFGQSGCEGEILFVHPFVDQLWSQQIPNREDRTIRG